MYNPCMDGGLQLAGMDHRRKAGSEDRIHTSGGVVVATDNNLGVVVQRRKSSYEGTIARASVNAAGGMRFLPYICVLKVGRPETKP